MNELWTTLVPLIIGSALVPVQVIVTILLLRSPGRAVTAAAWVGGMTALRLVQGLVFGIILDAAEPSGSGASGGAGSVVPGLLLVVGLLLLATAVRQLVADDDPDTPPPKWMTMTASMGPGKGFLLGVGVLAIGAKFWVFTLTAVGAIGDADLGRSEAIVAFVLFVVLAESVHLVIIGMALFAPDSSDELLRRAADWLRARNAAIVTVLGFVFGVWFVTKALDGLGVL